MKKIEKIRLLQKYHMNIVSYKYFPRFCNLEKLYRECDYERISIRTQNSGIGSSEWLPKWVNIDKNEAFEILPQIIDEYDVLVSEAINPEQVVMGGTVALLEEKVILEVFYGSGTVDRITREGVIDKRWITSRKRFMFDINDNRICRLIEKAMILPFRDFILEFSCYDTPVGIFRKNYVIWDIVSWE